MFSQYTHPQWISHFIRPALVLVITIYNLWDGFVLMGLFQLLLLSICVCILKELINLWVITPFWVGGDWMKHLSRSDHGHNTT